MIDPIIHCPTCGEVMEHVHAGEYICSMCLFRTVFLYSRTDRDEVQSGRTASALGILPAPGNGPEVGAPAPSGRERDAASLA